MSEYRIRIKRGRRIVAVAYVTCSTDHDAVLKASELTDRQHGAEVWDSERLVSNLPPSNQPAQPAGLGLEAGQAG